MRNTEKLGLNLVEGADNARESFNMYNKNFEKIDEKLSSPSDSSIVINKLTVENQAAQGNYVEGNYLVVNAVFFSGGKKYIAGQKQIAINVKDLLSGDVRSETEPNSKYYIKAVNFVTFDGSAMGYCDLEVVKLASLDTEIENELSNLNYVLGQFETNLYGGYSEGSLTCYPNSYLDDEISEFIEYQTSQIDKLSMVDRLIPVTVIFIEDNAFVLPKVVYNGVLHEIINPVINFKDGGYLDDIDYYIILDNIYEASISEYPPRDEDSRLLATFRVDGVSGEFKFTYQCNPVFVKGAEKTNVNGIDLSGYVTKKEVEENIARIDGDLSGHSRSISEHSEKLDTLENRANEHEVSAEAHNDIRLFIKELQTKVNTLLDSDDTTLDQMSEVVAYIKANKELIESVTTAKVNVDDIIDNLTTNVSNKPLSAAQGVALKSLIDNIKMPTKLSELNDDVGYVTKEELINKTNIPFNISIYRNDQYGFDVSWYILQGDGTIAHPIENIDLSGHISNDSFSGIIYLVNDNNEWHAAIEPSGKYIECFAWYYDTKTYNQFAIFPVAFDYFYNAEISNMISEINNLKTLKANKANTKNILESVLEANSEYYLGDVSADTTLAFPSSAEIGDIIYINFNCASQFALTIDMTNTSDIDIDIEEGVSYEIFASWNGSVWILGYNEYTVS